MKLSNIVIFALSGPVLGSLFFEDSHSDKIKAKLSTIGYEVLDTAGLVKDSVIESFDKESIDDWLAAHGVYDAGNQFLEVAKEHRDWLLEDISDYAKSGNEEAAKFLSKGKEFYTEKSTDASNAIWNAWSDSKLKEFLDSRGIDVPQYFTREYLLDLVSRAKANAPTDLGLHWFDGWSREELAVKLKELDESIEGTREELADRLYKSYTSSFENGKEEGAKAAEVLAQKLGEWKEATVETFNSWNVEDLKEYLQGFGADVAQTKDALVESAKNNYNYFVYGEVKPQGLLESIKFRAQKAGSGLRNYVAKFWGDSSILHLDL